MPARRVGILAAALTAGAVAAASVVPLAAGAAGGEGTGVDLTALPLDAVITASPQVGAITSCQTTFNGPGATAGPWIDEDAGTFDLTAKPSVDGSVSWPSSLSILFGSTGATRIISSNDLPDHPTGTFPIALSDDAHQWDTNPNQIRSQSLNMPVPTRPGIAAEPGCLGLGSVGIMLSGAALFNALDAQGRDAVAYEIPDTCGGHPQQAGLYHYHAISACQDDPADGEHSPLLGYARDGYGVYGHHGEDGEVLTNADLDACHGHVHTVEWDGVPRVMYHYHATWEYPYTIGCYRGAAMTTTPTDCNVAPPDNGFADVDPERDAAFLDAVDWVDCHDLLTGTSFRPGNALNRKNAVLLLWRFAGRPTGAPASSFTDVAASASYHDALDWAVAEGVFVPGAGGAFRPAGAVTRSQFAVMLWRLLGAPTDAPDIDLTDVGATSWYHDALDWAVDHEVLAPSSSGAFRPGAAVKRKVAVGWLSALAASPDAWVDYAGTPPDTLRRL
ncbi:MAG: YHYH protein [Acidimicrobiales bacterium]|nr:YHYH protein [Acidimicrobiales bacterium]